MLNHSTLVSYLKCAVLLSVVLHTYIQCIEMESGQADKIQSNLITSKKFLIAALFMHNALVDGCLEMFVGSLKCGKGTLSLVYFKNM